MHDRQPSARQQGWGFMPNAELRKHHHYKELEGGVNDSMRARRRFSFELRLTEFRPKILT